MCLEITEQLPCEEIEHELPWDIQLVAETIAALKDEKATLNMGQLCDMVYKNALPSPEKMKKKSQKKKQAAIDDEGREKRTWFLNRFFAEDMWGLFQKNDKKQVDRKEICD